MHKQIDISFRTHCIIYDNKQGNETYDQTLLRLLKPYDKEVCICGSCIALRKGGFIARLRYVLRL